MKKRKGGIFPIIFALDAMDQSYSYIFLNDTIWYKNLSCINDLNCFLSFSIIADIVTYVSFGKPVDGSLILEIISYLSMSGYTGKASYNFFMSL